MKLSKAGKLEIKKFDGDWWHASNEKAFHNMAEELIDKGFSEEDAIDFLERAYWVVSSEYGN